MNTLKKLEKRLATEPANVHDTAFKNLVEALCLKEPLDMAALFELPMEDFELAVAIIKDWRLDRYTKTKERLREMVGLPEEQK
jgi:hypothetical protein